MGFRICKIVAIESGHMLSKHPDDCRYPHGHSRQVEIVLSADTLDENDMVCDFKVVKDAIKDFLDSFEHAMCVNTEDPMFESLKKAYGDKIIGFENTDPTTEVIARLMYEEIGKALRAYDEQSGTPVDFNTRVRLESVKVWETSTSWAEYSAP